MSEKHINKYIDCTAANAKKDAIGALLAVICRVGMCCLVALNFVTDLLFATLYHFSVFQNRVKGPVRAWTYNMRWAA